MDISHEVQKLNHGSESMNSYYLIHILYWNFPDESKESRVRERQWRRVQTIWFRREAVPHQPGDSWSHHTYDSPVRVFMYFLCIKVDTRYPQFPYSACLHRPMDICADDWCRIKERTHTVLQDKLYWCRARVYRTTQVRGLRSTNCATSSLFLFPLPPNLNWWIGGLDNYSTFFLICYFTIIYIP